MVTTTMVAQYLKGLTFPCRKEECILFLRTKNAPQDVIGLMERMPERRFDSMSDVWSAVGEAY
jgi:hypothetical protein